MLMKRTKGFTLAELLVSSAVLMLMVALILGAYRGSGQNFVTGIELLNLNAQCRQGLRWFRRDLKWAYVLETSRSISGNNYVTANDELVLRLPSIDAAGDIINGQFDYVVYHLSNADNTVLERIVEANIGPPASARTSGVYIIARDIAALGFSSGGTGLSLVPYISGVSNVKMDLSTGKQILGGRNLVTTVTTSITLRNVD